MRNPLATLLHYANARPPYFGRVEFYALKDRLLKRFAQRMGTHWQYVKKECWGPYSWGAGCYEQERLGCEGAKCPNCLGDGIYSESWIELEVWRWGPYIFHRPVGQGWPNQHPEIPDIIGYIRHREVSDGRARNARFLLYLLSGEWRLLWLEFKSRRRARLTWVSVRKGSIRNDSEELPF